MSALVTGVGYLGSALVRRLLDEGERVVGLENFYCTSRPALEALASQPGFTLVEGDITSARDVARALALVGDGPLTVYHLAAQPSAAIAARDPAYTEQANLVGARLVLEAARDRGVHAVVFCSSFRVYGDDLAGRTVHEGMPYGRIGDLSHLSKVYVEQLGRMLGVPFAAVRMGVVYGVAPIMKRAPAFMTVPHVFAQRALAGEVLQVQDDRPLAFIHVDDAARALRAAAGLPTSGDPWQVANAVGEVLSIGEVARIVQRLAHDRGRFVRILGASTSPERYSVTSRLEAAGFRAERRLADTLGAVLDVFGARVAEESAA